MKNSANDWASPDPGKNITLAEADVFSTELAANLQVQFGKRYIQTTQNEIISEKELRSNQYMSPLPVNLYGHLAAASSQEINIAEFRQSLRDTAQAEDPTGNLILLLSEAMPQTNIPSLFTRLPAIQEVIIAAINKF